MTRPGPGKIQTIAAITLAVSFLLPVAQYTEHVDADGKTVGFMHLFGASEDFKAVTSYAYFWQEMFWVVPLIFFLTRGYIRMREWPKYLLMFVLGGMQGLLGWYMVKSGLVDVPHVSQYRLTAHLFAAFVIYAYMFWVAMSLLHPNNVPRKHEWYGKTLALFILVSVTVISGGFVAGLKAGKIYNTFPMMGDYWVPPGLMALEPFWRNFFDNMATVQFDHRLLAITTFILVVAYWFTARTAQLPVRARRAVHALLHTAVLQVALGIATLLLAVPVVLGAAHQGVAMLLFTVALYLVHALRRV